MYKHIYEITLIQKYFKIPFSLVYKSISSTRQHLIYNFLFASNFSIIF